MLDTRIQNRESRIENMAEPIIEQIAVALVAAVNEIRVTLGDWRQDLYAGRPKQVDFDNLLNGRAPASNGTVFISQLEDRETGEEGAQNTSDWEQDFAVTGFILPPADSDDSADTAINHAIADIRKKLWENKGRIGSLGWITLGPASIFRQVGYCGFEMTVTVHYLTKIDDPYTLG